MTPAGLDRANPEEAPAAATVALLGASLDLTGPALRVLDFLDEFVASPDLGPLLRHRGRRRETPPPPRQDLGRPGLSRARPATRTSLPQLTPCRACRRGSA